MIDKRRHTRIPISGIANITYKEKEKIHSIQTVIANISLQGIGVYAYDEIKIKTDVSITINFLFSDGSLKTDSLNGHVINNKKIDKTYYIGIQLDDEIDPDRQPFLSAYING